MAGTSHDSANGTAGIAIVGAGVSGLIAAVELLDQGYPADKINIYEASGRAGGRVQTVSLYGYPMDLGAHWTHGGTDNAFYKWLKQKFGDKIDDLVRLDDASDTVVLTKQGIFGPEFREERFKALEDQYALYERDHPGEDISLFQLAALTGDPLTIAYAKFMAHCWMAVEHSDEPGKQLSWLGFSSDPGGVGGLQFKNGMIEPVDLILDYLREKGVQVHTGCKIDEIVQPEFGEELDVNDACILNGEGGPYRADQVIMTAPFAVHKAGDIRYTPPLSETPDTKKEIDGVMVAKMAKVIVPFEDNFFKDKNIGSNKHIYVMTKDPPIFCHARTAGKPFVTIFVGPEDAEKVEKYDSTQLRALVEDTFDHLASQLKEFEGWCAYQNKPAVVTKWNTREFSRCAYTAPTVGEPRSGEPLWHGRVLIAGEATEESASTLAGACVSAIKAVQSVFDYARKRLQPRTSGQDPTGFSSVAPLAPQP